MKEGQPSRLSGPQGSRSPRLSMSDFSREERFEMVELVFEEGLKQ